MLEIVYQYMPSALANIDRSQLNAEIRKAQKNDIDVIVSIENICFTHSRLTKKHFTYFLRKGNCDLLVGEIDGMITGYILILYKQNSLKARIYSIAVLPQFRNSGQGHFLIKEAITIAKNKGCHSIYLEMENTNYQAQNFYRKLGFRVTAIIPDYYGKGIDATKFIKSFSD